MDNSRICFITMVSKLRTATSLVKEATTATHMLGLNFTTKSWAESSELMSVIMHGPYLKRTQLLFVIWRHRLWVACRCLPWSAVTFSRAIIVELDSEGSIVPTFTRNIRALAHLQIWNVRAPLYLFVQFKFSVYGLVYWTYTYTQLAMQSC